MKSLSYAKTEFRFDRIAPIKSNQANLPEANETEIVKLLSFLLRFCFVNCRLNSVSYFCLIFLFFRFNIVVGFIDIANRKILSCSNE